MPYNVVFLGGSITEGASATDYSKSYAAIVSNYLKKLHEKDEVNIINAGVSGTGSQFGLFRLNRDIINHDPDLVFIEFAVNDRIESSLNASITMEGIIRELLKLKKTPKIVLLITPSEMGDACSSVHKKIAYYYNIPSIDIQDYIWREIGRGKYTWKGIAVDNLHPNDLGHKLYGEYIVQCLSEDKILSSNPKFKNKSLMNYEFNNPQLISYEKATFYGHWREENIGIHKRIEVAAVSDIPGDCLELIFKGKYLAMFNVIGRDCGIAEINLDGANYNLDLYSNMDPYCTSTININNLPGGEHRLIIRVSENKNTNSNGHRVIIGYFFVEN